ncbi:hypothetical protein BKA65DRAFT_506871 [Rhexocercosporidium sp. MPI-PUGE-AT-0058]|nr:hypothetical protein BKA65DRAFT_506871 [Rhexocercosporidium sp. MPI-PUGE-AT-0058]
MSGCLTSFKLALTPVFLTVLFRRNLCSSSYGVMVVMLPCLKAKLPLPSFPPNHNVILSVNFKHSQLQHLNCRRQKPQGL